MNLHPMHPAAWVLDRLRADGWYVDDLLVFTRASTLVTAHPPRRFTHHDTTRHRRPAALTIADR